MSITVLWEDTKGVEVQGFGPHELLLSSVADDLCADSNEQPLRRRVLAKQILAQPKKGNGNVFKALQQDLRRYDGPVVAVIDRDKAHRLWRNAQPPPTNCIQGISQQFRRRAPGPYDLVFLVNHTEDLLNAVLASQSKPLLTEKASPSQRDSILATVSWSTRELRLAVRRGCPSFDRLVKIVAGHAAKL